MHPARATTLAKLIWMLHAENENELVNAARAITRHLRADKIDLPALTKLLAGPASQEAGQEGETSAAINRRDLDVIRRCRHAKSLSNWDRIVLDKLEEQLHLGVRLSAGQRLNLQSIYRHAVPDHWSPP